MAETPAQDSMIVKTGQLEHVRPGQLARKVSLDRSDWTDSENRMPSTRQQRHDSLASRTGQDSQTMTGGQENWGTRVLRQASWDRKGGTGNTGPTQPPSHLPKDASLLGKSSYMQ